MATPWTSESEREEYLKNQAEQEKRNKRAMARYIDVDLLLEEVEDSRPINWTGSEVEAQRDFDFDLFKHIIGYQPTADVVEVKRGEWVDKPNPQWRAYDIRHCNKCGWNIPKNNLRKKDLNWNFCPNCGARMVFF